MILYTVSVKEKFLWWDTLYLVVILFLQYDPMKFWADQTMDQTWWMAWIRLFKMQQWSQAYPASCGLLKVPPEDSFFFSSIQIFYFWKIPLWSAIDEISRRIDNTDKSILREPCGCNVMGLICCIVCWG